MSETILEQIYRQEQQALHMIPQTPDQRAEYLRFCAMTRQQKSQSKLFQQQINIPRSNTPSQPLQDTKV